MEKQKLSDDDLSYVNGGMNEMTEEALKGLFQLLMEKLKKKDK